VTKKQITTDYQREQITKLSKLAAARSDELTEHHEDHQHLADTLASQNEEVVQQLKDEYKQERSRLETEYADALSRVETVYSVESKTAKRSFEDATDKVHEEADLAITAAKQKWIHDEHAAMEKFNAVKYDPRTEFEGFEKELEQRRFELDALEHRANAIVVARWCKLPPAEDTDSKWVTELPNAMEDFSQALDDSHSKLVALSNQARGRFIADGWPFLIGVLLGLAAIYPAGASLGWSNLVWIAIAIAAGVLPCIVAFWLVFPSARRLTMETFGEFREFVTKGRRSLSSALEGSREKANERTLEIIRLKDEEVGKAKQEFSTATKQVEEKRESQLLQYNESLPEKRNSAERVRNEKLEQISQKYPDLLDQLKGGFEEELERLQSELQQDTLDNDRTFEENTAKTEQEWQEGLANFEQSTESMNDYCAEVCPDWTTIDWPSWKSSQAAPRALQFGRYRPTFEQLEDKQFSMPAVLSYPEQPSLLFKADGTGREIAIASMQNIMLRMLTSMPPGKVRFTIIDPTGLGQNFSAFMHLADFDERLVSNRIWTESGHITRQLSDLTEHMENVIQKYLRNEYQSIQEYNAHAGEVAEPFQILVVANFPANFSEDACRRLTSIANSGSRCGVYTLILNDTRMKLPRNFDLEELEKNSAALEWDGAWFRWKHESLKEFPVELDQPPSDDGFTSAVKIVGREAKDSNRVEVPFRTVVAKDDQWWKGDSRGDVEVALGRVGATKLQSMRLGKGTSQHVLISGKTGSGKSTLLHALITNLAIHYSPDEIQFYLIDFKKGVEFKPYATHAMPHARVIAIESEREFGLSVLERLDLELKQRGDLFRNHGVQSVKGYRDANPDAVMPRTLLVIDEFQELFVKDDRISQESGLLLDRLVRQGRAFGIHVLLGSQTLAGAYTLARSTIGQMAVRIALQCSEADAHLILSEDNTAARLLSRPGEAIYNDANGLFEGNHPFQVVWLPAEEHEEYLRRVNEMADKQNRNDPPPLVFEGNVPADPIENQSLCKAISSPTADPHAAIVSRAWLGAAVAIKEPTSVVFRRQAGANLLVVGQHDELAQGLLANCLVGLAAGLSNGSPKDAKFYILDGARPDGPDAGFWTGIAKRLPLNIELVTPKTVTDSLGELAAEVARRSEADDDSAPARFVLIYNLSRFRDLKKSDDDLGFSDFGDDEDEKIDKQFNQILREGPNYGVHSLIWSDTYNNVNRWFDRQMLKNMEMRVLFQMGANDSSNLMDSPAASKLGVHRAYYYSEEHGDQEKFRPYGVPTNEWINFVAEELGKRQEGNIEV
jgi:S-DNA-T family DNA segregation ATPase FtsK/SpoIIIE